MLGNIAIICAIHRTKRLHNPTNYLIVNLAISDVLGSVFIIPIAVASQLRFVSEWTGGWFGSVSCPLLVFLQGLFTNCSWFSMTVIAVDRFCAVMFPLRRIVTPRVTKAFLAGTWVSASLVVSPTLYAMRVVEKYGKHFCWEIWEPLFDTAESRKHYTVFLFICAYVIPLMVIGPMYACVIYRVWFRKVPGNVTDAIQRVQSRSKKKVLKMLMMVVIIFAVCSFPGQIFNFLQYSMSDVLPKCALSQNAIFVIFALVTANSAINPSIYFIFSDEFRQALRTILHSLLCSCCFRGVKKISRDQSKYCVSQETIASREITEMASFRTLNESNSYINKSGKSPVNFERRRMDLDIGENNSRSQTQTSWNWDIHVGVNGSDVRF